MQRIKHLLVALAVLIPLAAAIGFFQMAAEVLAVGLPPPTSANVAIMQVTLAAWKDDITMTYLGAILAVFMLGRLHTFLLQRGRG
jgi:hypothetical protein